MRVDPVSLYKAASEILRLKRAAYIEVINDAADTLGIDSILKSGFAPCAYFPALKKHGSKRRDFIVFGKEFEKRSSPGSGDNHVLLEYLAEYRKLAEK
jgi:hypothetical protein